MNRKNKTFFLLMMAMLFASCLRAQAAFPPDMTKKPVVAEPLYEASFTDIVYYNSPALAQSDMKGSIDGSSLVLTATKVQEGSIYGSFEHEGRKETGWFDLGVFVAYPDSEHIYATVRDGMAVYTDSSMDQVRDKIKKYSGVIMIGSEGYGSQVIYQKKKYYGIGWMTEEDLTNTLLYDGRDKQVMADGIYRFRSGYQDSPEGGSPIRKQENLLRHAPLTWELAYVSDNNYYLKNPETERYLTAYTGDRGLSWNLIWTGEPDKLHSLFHLERMNGAFTIQNLTSRLYLGQTDQQELTLSRYRIGKMLGGSDESDENKLNDSNKSDNNPANGHQSELSVSWRISALQTVADKEAPMVFTQYDPAWCGTAYGSEGCMGTAGCGILATVNAVYGLSGHYMDVMELADYAVEKHYRIVGSGTDEGIFKAACKKFGQKYNFAWDGHGSDLKELNKKLAAGDTAVVHVPGHYVAIVARDKKNNKYLMLDSNYLPKREDSAFGDWITPDRLLSGSLESQQFYYFKLKDPSWP
ncbi:MAG: RICIN domain-containing protein [Eubacterium sp.]|nr:RICIN domain-containing protein [Eubacterium sp.]